MTRINIVKKDFNLKKMLIM